MNRVKEKAIRKPQLSPIKRNGRSWRALGAIDLHFHGAFGVDLMTANERQLDRLARQLFQRGTAAFLPTTLSEKVPELEATLARLGKWISRKHAEGPRAGEAFPLGIHLEGPFISKSCCGAHPTENLIRPSLALLKKWMSISQNNLKRITIAPEIMPWDTFCRILAWADEGEITISLGHSECDAITAKKAFDLGVRSITHAWNAMPFHHRAPGILGEALGRPNLFIELIPDAVHLSDTVVDWTIQLHPQGICWVSDAVPAAETAKSAPFGPLRVRVSRGAGRTSSGALAGGGYTLSQMMSRFWERRTHHGEPENQRLQLVVLKGLTEWPLASQPSSKKWLKSLAATHSFEYRFEKTLSVRPLALSPNS